METLFCDGYYTEDKAYIKDMFTDEWYQVSYETALWVARHIRRHGTMYKNDTELLMRIQTYVKGIRFVVHNGKDLQIYR